MDITPALKNTVSISMFNRGLAGKIFDEVKKFGAKVVMKNNEPACVLLSPEEYIALMDELNDAKLMAIAAERLDNLDLSKTIPAEQVWQELGIDSKTLENCDEVELE